MAARSARAFDPLATLSEFAHLDTPEVRSALDGYITARRSKHGNWTGQGMRIALRKLNGATPAQAVAAFEAATEVPWKTIWPNGTHNGSNGHARNGATVVNESLENFKELLREQGATP